MDQKRTSSKDEPRQGKGRDQFAELMQQGMLLFNKNEYDESVDIFSRAVELEPNSNEAWFYLGESWSLQGYGEEANRCYQKVVQLNPHNAEAWIGIICDQLNRRQYTDAILACEHLIRLRPDNAVAWSYFGECLTGLRRYFEAIAAYERAAHLQPDNAYGWYSLGMSWYRQGNIAKGIAYFERSVALNPDDADRWFRLGYSYMITGRFDRAGEAFLHASLQRSGDFKILKYLGLVCLLNEEMEKAVMYLTQSWELSSAGLNDEETPDGARYLAHAFLMTKQVEKAMEMYQMSVFLGTAFEESFNDLRKDYFTLRMSTKIPRAQYDALLQDLHNWYAQQNETSG